MISFVIVVWCGLKHFRATLHTFTEYNINTIKKDKQGKICFADKFTLAEIPVIQIIIKDKILNFLVDTGANDNLINESVFNELFAGEEVEFKLKGDIVGASGAISGVKDTSIEFYIDTPFYIEKFKDTFSVMDFTEAFNGIENNTGVVLSGVLGSNFFKNNQWRIDYSEMVIWLKK